METVTKTKRIKIKLQPCFLEYIPYVINMIDTDKTHKIITLVGYPAVIIK